MASKLIYIALIVVLCAVAFAKPQKKIGRQYEDEDRFGDNDRKKYDDEDRYGDNRKGDDRKGDDRKGDDKKKGYGDDKKGDDKKGDDRKGDDRKGYGDDKKGDDKKGDDRKGDDRKGYGDDEDRYGDDRDKKGDDRKGDDRKGYGDDKKGDDKKGDDRKGDDRKGYGDDEDRYGDDRDRKGDDRDGDDRDRKGDDRDGRYGDDRDGRYGDDRDGERKGYGKHHHEAPAIKSAKVFKVCTYVNGAQSSTPVCTGDEGSCLLVENAKCYTTIFGTSLQINLVGETATILYFNGSTYCATVAGFTTGIFNNVVLDTCVVDADPTGAATQTLGWKVSRIRF